MSKTLPTERKLNSEQRQAVEYGEGPLLIIAGAGTGKTTVVTERIKHLITSDIAKPSEILALTFTEKAAHEMEERVDILMPYGYTQLWISTFHSFCDRILRLEAHNIGLNPSYRLLSDADITMLIRKNLFTFDLDYFRPLGNPTKFISGMITHFSRLRDEDITPNQYADWVKHKAVSVKGEEEELEIKKYQELARCYEQYEELKVKEGFMDFSNLIGYTLDLFRKRPNILKQYQNQFKFLLVDEFQDTNISQNELVKLLAGKKQNITVVADDDQAVYKFRGASVSNVISFRKNFPHAKLIVLSKNYRSTQTILDKSYRLIQHNNPDRLEVKEWITKQLISTRGITGKPISFTVCDRVENEADEVAKEIRKLVFVIPTEAQGRVEESHSTEFREKDSSISPPAGGSARNDNYSWKDFAILVRANNHAEPFVRAFRRHGIPFQFLGPGQLFRQPEIKDLICYLQILANFEDNVALFKVLAMEYFDISPRDLVALANFSRRYNVSLFESIEICLGQRLLDNVRLPFISNETKEKLTTIFAMINRHLKLLTRETAGQLLYYFLEDTGILKSILDYQFLLDEKRANNVMKFFNKLKTYEAEHEDASVQTVLDWITLAMELGESPLAADDDWTDNDAVNILTVHSAKGLEFPVVFLVNLVAQRFPTIERREQIPIPDELIKEELPLGDYHEEEERRLFYVGMTRARDLLYFTAAKYYGEGKREKKISPFVYEALGDDVVATEIANKPDQLSLLEWRKIEETPEKNGQTPLKLTYISYSQIECFKICPLHYKLRYLLNIPPAPSPALSFGNSMHKTLKEWYQLLKQGSILKENEVIKLLQKNWTREGYSDRRYEKEMFERGKSSIHEYYKKEFDPEKKPLLLEQPFTLSMKNENSFLKIGGRIDRIDEVDGMIEIIDYKTGRLPTKREVDANLQLSMYALAATEIKEYPFNRRAEEVRLSLYFFDASEKITLTKSQEQLQVEKAKIMELVHEIETSDFRCSGGTLCMNCEYKMFCRTHEETS